MNSKTMLGAGRQTHEKHALLEAELAFQYDDADTANNVACLIEIDNRAAPKTLEIRTWQDNEKVLTHLKSVKAATLFATIDDLLFTEKLITNLLDMSNGL